MKLNFYKDEEAGFSLVELIVVIAIMVVLFSLLVPSVTNYLKKAQKTADMTAAALISDAVALALTDVEAQNGYIYCSQHTSQKNYCDGAEVGGAGSNYITIAYGKTGKISNASWAHQDGWQDVNGTPAPKKGRDWWVPIVEVDNKCAKFGANVREALGLEKNIQLSYWAKVTPEFPSRNPRAVPGTQCDVFVVVSQEGTYDFEVWAGCRIGGDVQPVYELFPDPDPIYFDSAG